MGTFLVLHGIFKGTRVSNSSGLSCSRTCNHCMGLVALLWYGIKDKG